MATMKDVAGMAGVSTTTVSRVINGGSASPAVTRRVMDAIDTLGYQVSASARSLKGKRSNIVGVMVVDVSNPSTTQTLHGITSVVHAHGMTVMLASTGGVPQEELASLEMFAGQHVSGIIYMGTQTREDVADALNRFPAPVVVGGQERGSLRWPIVVFDNYDAGYDIARELLGLGHRRLAFISAPLDDEHVGRFRLQGFLDALAHSGVTPPDHCVQYGDFSVEAGHAAMQRILDGSGPPPTAVAAASDTMAIGALRCLRDRGLRVPGDVSLVGFDDIPVAARLIPSLSSVALDERELGEMCAELLHRMTQREDTDVTRVVLGHRIILRESVTSVL
tara:strand:+ start:963 stop:1967 length:1005 start_codon:yes stop_codon:yes gene_type:complete